ncbi:hypothetical protein GOB94_10795 [Granulicella sp. 5B5]|uniref:polysaccharide biosynthesis C-terminal domain-containing protein n=1 Tax=Granulicella sp. 5B5 TaxID=1617967 RepID=UPI0015F687B5|nr:polysaccharide biosynthesis C-terminal domain-containing protein [Granulicella sp. 5B5]QMV19111.1 hypothetical protein GOB94_10795 [Granulicella sp. 5B5]
MRRRLIKNAISNVGRGGAAAIIALVLPPVLIRYMHSTNYAVWVLILQVSAYMGFLDFGLQTAVGRYIAFAEEKQDYDWRDGIFSTAMAGLCLAATVGMLAVIIVALFAGHIFPSVPAALLQPMRVAILIAGASTAIGLPASAWNGVFVGRQRFEVPAITVASGKLLSSIGLIAAAMTGHSLVFMACVLASVNLLTYTAQYVAFRWLAPGIHYRLGVITQRLVRELSSYCLSLSVWSFSTLLVTGFDLILVGRFDFSAVPVYSASAVLITFLGGLQTALFGVIMPHSATLQASGDSRGLGELLLKSTKLAVMFLLITGLPLVVFAGPIIRVWLGAQYAVNGTNILIVLVIGNMLRLVGVPYASILVGTGQQRLVIFGPLAEGFTNLIASILLGWKFGAIGVALGTLVGAIAGLAVTCLYNIPRTRSFMDVPSSRLLKESLGWPVVFALPLVTASICSPSPQRQRFLAVACCIFVALCLTLLTQSWRHRNEGV